MARPAELPAGLNPLVGVVDLLLLALVELVVPQSYAGICFLVVFIVAAHAHVQGEQLGIALAVLAVVLFVPLAAFGDPPVSGALLAFYEVLFSASVLVGGDLHGPAAERRVDRAPARARAEPAHDRGGGRSCGASSLARSTTARSRSS